MKILLKLIQVSGQASSRMSHPYTINPSSQQDPSPCQPLQHICIAVWEGIFYFRLSSASWSLGRVQSELGLKSADDHWTPQLFGYLSRQSNHETEVSHFINNTHLYAKAKLCRRTISHQTRDRRLFLYCLLIDDKQSAECSVIASVSTIDARLIKTREI